MRTQLVFAGLSYPQALIDKSWIETPVKKYFCGVIQGIEIVTYASPDDDGHLLLRLLLGLREFSQQQRNVTGAFLTIYPCTP